MKTECLQCGHNFELKILNKDELGTFTNCPNCGGSFDVDNKIIDVLNDFCIKEYDEEIGQENLKDLTRIPIMFTSYEKGEVDEIDEELSVQVFADIKKYILFVEYNGIKVYEEKYETVDEFIKMLECLYFDSWVNTDEIDEYIKLKYMTSYIVLDNGGFYDFIRFTKKYNINDIKSDLASISGELMAEYEGRNSYDYFTDNVIKELGQRYKVKYDKDITDNKKLVEKLKAKNESLFLGY